MLPGRVVVSGLIVLLAACGDDGGSGPVDAPPITVDIDNGSCGDQIRFTGEYVDWDTEASFCGINDALFEVTGDGAMDNTAPNGRFDLCVPDQAVTRLDVTQPAGNSQCTTPPAAYTIPALAIANKQVIQAGAFWSGRAFTTARQATVFQMVGEALDPAKAQVFVHVDGPAREVSLTAAHAAAQAVSGATWIAGATGTDVFFPNVVVGGGTTTLAVAGGALGTGELPVVAGTLTLVTVKTN